jgi:hypothetical protein
MHFFGIGLPESRGRLWLVRVPKITSRLCALRQKSPAGSWLRLSRPPKITSGHPSLPGQPLD